MKICKYSKDRRNRTAEGFSGHDKVQIILEQQTKTNETMDDRRDMQTKKTHEDKLTDSELYAEHDYQEWPASGNNSGSRVNLGSRPERSQFFKK